MSLQNYTLPLASGAGVQEVDNPLNDGVVNTIKSYFSMTPATTFTPSYHLPVPAGEHQHPRGDADGLQHAAAVGGVLSVLGRRLPHRRLR